MPQEVQAFAADTADIRGDRQQGTDASAPGGGGTAQLASPLLGPTAPVQQEADPGNSDVIVSAAVNQAEERRLPIFEAVESSWFKGAREAPGSARTAVRAGGQWSSPADEGWRAAQTVESPAAGSPTEAGLPKRLPNANLVPGTIPGSQPRADVPSRSAADIRNRLAGFKRGVAEGRAAAAEPGEPAGENESLSVRPGRLRPGMTRRGSMAGAATRLRPARLTGRTGSAGKPRWPAAAPADPSLRRSDRCHYRLVSMPRDDAMREHPRCRAALHETGRWRDGLRHGRR